MAKYSPRTKEPSTTDKNFIHSSKGGYNRCIEILKGSCLPNCFKKDTKFITDKGVKTLEECLDQNINVLNIDGEWKPATVKYFGKNQLVRIKLSNGKEFYCTPNHRWFVVKKSRYKNSRYEKMVELTTDELKTSKNYHIPYIQRTYSDDVKYSDEGVRHGFIFGDGTLYGEHSKALICGNKKDFMLPFFQDVKLYYDDNGTIETAGVYDASYKQVPDIDTCSDEYLMGFLIGYLASDGCITEADCRIACVDKDVLSAVKDICARLKIRTFDIHSETKDKQIGEYYYENHTVYHLPLAIGCISPAMILNPIHREKLFSKTRKDIKYCYPVEIEYTGIIDDVYCVVEPETHTMVLDGNILTGQCVGYAWGRWREILGKNHNLSLNNAENWWGNTADGYKRGQTPKLGAVICWRKGKAGVASDGAGHVAIVEQIKSNGDIVTSESVYGGARFRTKTYTKASGYALASHVFQGFIYLPVTFEEEKTSTTSVKKKSNKEIAQEVIDGKWGNGETRKKKLKEAGYSYDAVQAEVNKLLSASSSATSNSASFKNGDKVKLVKGATFYDGSSIASWVFNSTLYVRDIDGDRVVISTVKTGAVTGAVKKKYLQKA